MASYEDVHVHAVYEAIAPHFSATRHSPWPMVKRFLLAQAPSSIGLDIGCGNGKYLGVNPALHMLASDRSPSLVSLASEQHGRGGEASSSSSSSAAAALLTADSLALPFRPHSADFVICIAVIHHFSTAQRRRAAIAALLRCLRPEQGRALVYVWALEQAGSRRGWDGGSEQDTLVPWVMRKKKKKKKNHHHHHHQQQQQQQGEDTGVDGDDEPETTYQRYYHLYKEGELEEDARQAGGEVCESGYEKDNWWVILKVPNGRDINQDQDEIAESSSPVGSE